MICFAVQNLCVFCLDQIWCIKHTIRHTIYTYILTVALWYEWRVTTIISHAFVSYVSFHLYIFKQILLCQTITAIRIWCSSCEHTICLRSLLTSVFITAVSTVTELLISLWQEVKCSFQVPSFTLSDLHMARPQIVFGVLLYTAGKMQKILSTPKTWFYVCFINYPVFLLLFLCIFC